MPARFLHMLRMFKVTSPMSVGSWVLAGFGAATAPAAAHALIGSAWARRAAPRRSPPRCSALPLAPTRRR